MLLKVGELARKTGLTVRTLHHYDEIGLLKPSARSSSGYRLYGADDITRLHAIQGLRQLGFSLSAIGGLLQGGTVPLADIVAGQIRALDEEMARARELRTRLALLQATLAADRAPDPGQWLATLEQVEAYRKFLTPAQLRRIFERWRGTRAEWEDLLGAVRNARDRRIAPESDEAQRLAARWMDVSMRWMGGDMELAVRWGRMVGQTAAASGKTGLDAAVIQYMEQAVSLRMAAFRRHLSDEELERIDKRQGPRWADLARRIGQSMERGASPAGGPAQALLREWDDLLDDTTGHDPVLREKFERAYREEPILRIGHVIEPAMRAFIDRARAARECVEAADRAKSAKAPARQRRRTP